MIDFTVDAQIASDFTITIMGPVSAPIVSVKRMDTRQIIGKIDMSALSAAEGEKLIFSTLPNEAGMKLDNGNSSTDLTQYIGIDVNTPSFFQLPANVPLQLTLCAASLENVTSNIRIFRYYRTV